MGEPVTMRNVHITNQFRVCAQLEILLKGSWRQSEVFFKTDMPEHNWINDKNILSQRWIITSCVLKGLELKAKCPLLRGSNSHWDLKVWLCSRQYLQVSKHFPLCVSSVYLLVQSNVLSCYGRRSNENEIPPLDGRSFLFINLPGRCASNALL